jgi:hypothetical protein
MKITLLPWWAMLIAIILVALFIIGFPWAIVWSINTLFGLSIPYTLETWLAASVLAYIFDKSITIKSKAS